METNSPVNMSLFTNSYKYCDINPPSCAPIITAQILGVGGQSCSCTDITLCYIRNTAHLYKYDNVKHEQSSLQNSQK